MAQAPLGPHTPTGALGLAGPQSGNPGCYPRAKATHEAVLNERALFIRLLRKLHEDLGTQFRTPTVSGKELDLHLLYRQVTTHGGLEAVVTGKKWTEVSQPFMFPPSFTSKSFTLRKMYSRLLHDFEQVYFFGNTGPPIVPYGADGTKIEGGAAMASSNALYRRRRVEVATPMQPSYGGGGQMQHPMLTAFLQQGGGLPPGNLVGQPVSGTVTMQFDHGFFVNLSLAGQDYMGVLYAPPLHLLTPLPALGSGSSLGLQSQGQLPSQLPGQIQAQPHTQGVPGMPIMPPPQGLGFYPTSPDNAPASSSYFPGFPTTPIMASAKRQKVVRDPNQPKQNKTPFNFFSIDARAAAKERMPNASQKDISKTVGEMWAKTPEEEKQKYIRMAQEDKERYQKALSEYKRDSLKRESSLDQAGPSSAWAPQPSSLGAGPPLSLGRGHLEDPGPLSSGLGVPLMGTPLLPPQPATLSGPGMHPSFGGAPGQGTFMSASFPPAPPLYAQPRQQRFVPFPGGPGEMHEDAAAQSVQEMMRENEVAGQLAGMRHHPMPSLHVPQHGPPGGSYAMERGHLPLPLLPGPPQMQPPHPRGPHVLQEPGYEEDVVEQEEYEDEGSEQE